MNWLAALMTGFGLGLTSFGALWLMVRQLVRQPRRRIWIGATGLVRLFLIGLVCYCLSRHGLNKLVSGLVGLWLARGFVIRGLLYGR